MGLMDIFFGPFERWGFNGGFVLLILVAIVGVLFAVWFLLIGVNLLAALSFILDLVLTYGVLVMFLYLMWYRRPKQ
ncbi:MAG: hypothetical protein ACFFEF_05250 [Candidatus Thorarchaeota archaeon]